MAQFATQSSLKLLFNGEGVSSLLEHKDPFHYKFRSIQTRRRRLGHIGSTSSIYYSSSSLSSKSNRCNAEARPSDCVYDDDDSDDDEFETDNLACFRGLVLDVSYRSTHLGFSSQLQVIRDQLIFAILYAAPY